MSEEDVMELIKAYEDFMKHSEVEQLKYEIRTPKCTVKIQNVEVEIPTENQLIATYEKKAAEMNVSVEYYLQEFA